MARLLFARLIALVVGVTFVLGYGQQPVGAESNPPVVVIVMENHSFGATDPGVANNMAKYVVGNPYAPYVNNTLIPSGTLFTNYTAHFQTSLPNYLMLTAGTDLGCPKNPCRVDSDPNENLFHLMGEAGIPFASLEESMPANCTLVNSGRYQTGHNPEAYYKDIDAKASVPYGCPVTDLPMTPSPLGTPDAWPNPLPAFTFITPDSCDNMHGTTDECPAGGTQRVADGDMWLAANVPALLAQGAIVIVTFDEGTGNDTTGGGGHVMTVMAGPGVPAGVQDATPFKHVALLAGLLGYFDLSPLLAGSANVAPLVIPRPTPYPAPTISGIAPEAGPFGSAVTINGASLTNAYAVSFGGSPGAIAANSDTSITVTVPPDAVSGPVSVSTIGGVATSADTFTVTGTPPPPTVVQHKLASANGGLSASATWSQATTPGDLLIATVGWYGSGTPTTPTGWIRAVSSGSIAVFYRTNAPATSGSVAIPFSAKVNWVLSMSEWSNVAASTALDKVANATSNTAAATTATTGTTTATVQPVEVAIGAVRAVGTVGQSGPTNGFALLDTGAATNDSFGIYDLITTATGQQSTSVTLSGAVKWRGVIVTFRGL